MVKILGEKINDFSGVLLYVPKNDELVVIRPADGEGLSDEDLDEGFVDSVTYDRYNFQGEFLDGGFQLFPCVIEEAYENLGDLLPQVISYIYNDTVNGVVCLGDAKMRRYES